MQTTDNTKDKITIQFESVSGQRLTKRFNELAKYYASGLAANGSDWTATEIKKSFIRNIERGTIVIKCGGHIIATA